MTVGHRDLAGARPIALAGLASLAAAMGIGRFAFTPVLPMMLAEGRLDLPAASWLASANYLGYLAGSAACMVEPWLAARLGRDSAVASAGSVRGGLVAITLLTAAMALPWAGAWPLWRFLAGVASAVVLLGTSGWCLARLARLEASMLGAVIYAGPGAGIVASGALAGAVLAVHGSAAATWGLFGALAAALTVAVWPVFRGDAAGPPAADGVPAPATPPGRAPAAAHLAAPTAPHAAASTATEFGLLAVVYGLAGFGYIVTATFLPVIARQALPGSAWIDAFWPIFGAAVMTGAWLASRLPARGDGRLRLALAYGLQATGIAVGLVWPSLPGFVLGSVLLGLPFTAITFFAMQEVRRLRPAAVASGMGLATVLYGIGQIVGPLLVGVLLRDAPTPRAGFDLALETAAGALLLGAAVLLAMRGRYPLPRRA